MGQLFNSMCACRGSLPSSTVHVLRFAGITNYIDLGLQVVTDMVDGPAGGNGTNGPERLGGAPGSAALGAAWQVQRALWWDSEETTLTAVALSDTGHNCSPQLGCDPVRACVMGLPCWAWNAVCQSLWPKRRSGPGVMAVTLGQMRARSSEPGPATHPSVVRRARMLAAATQVNKSVLVKGRLSTDSVGASVAVKSWWNPSSTAAVSCTYPFGAYNPYPKLGLTFGCENFGNIRCARPSGAVSELTVDNSLGDEAQNRGCAVVLTPCGGADGANAQLAVRTTFVCWYGSMFAVLNSNGNTCTLRLLQV